MQEIKFFLFFCYDIFLKKTEENRQLCNVKILLKLIKLIQEISHFVFVI